MRILVLANLPPHVLGGAENQVASLVEAWRMAGHAVTVAGHRIPGGVETLGRAEVPTVRIRTLFRGGRGLRGVSYFASLAAFLLRRGGDFDVIYSRGLGDGALTVCLLRAMGLRTPPLVACPINARGAGDAAFIRSVPGWRRLVRLVDRHCRAVNLIAPAMEEDLDRLGIVSPARYRVPNGIRLRPPVERRQVGTPRRLVWSGRMEPQKGLEPLLHALAGLRGRVPPFVLELVGDGSLRGELQRLAAALGLETQVRFSGAVPREAVRRRLEQADLFVLPSLYEGMSNSGLEAMEASLPLVLTRCGGLDAHLDRSVSWQCPPDDPEGLRRALEAALVAPDERLLEMGRAARRLAESRFCHQEVARRNLEMLASVVAEARKCASSC